MTRFRKFLAARTDDWWLLLVVTGVAMGMVLGYTLAFRFPLKFDKDGWDVATAIGTVSAVVVALYFGLGANSKARKQAHALAVIAASRQLNELAGLILNLTHFWGSCTHASEQHCKNKDFFTGRHFKWVSSPLLQLSSADLLTMSTLQGDVSLLIARGLSCLEQVTKQRGLMLAEEPDFSQIPQNERFLQAWGSYTLQSILCFQQAGKEITTAIGRERLWPFGESVDAALHHRAFYWDDYT